MRKILLFTLLLAGLGLSAQKPGPMKHRFPIWYAPAKNTATWGLSLGPVHNWSEKAPFAIHGIGVELGIGLLLPIGVGNSFSDLSAEEVADMDTMPAQKRLNGINLSITGSVGLEQLNGLSFNGMGTAVGRLRGFQASLVLSMGWEVNGISTAICFNDAYRVNGAQIALMGNISAQHKGLQLAVFNKVKRMRGVQIGIINKCPDLRGLQIGIWNEANGRGLPLLNWARAKPAPK